MKEGVTAKTSFLVSSYFFLLFYIYLRRMRQFISRYAGDSYRNEVSSHRTGDYYYFNKLRELYSFVFKELFVKPENINP